MKKSTKARVFNKKYRRQSYYHWWEKLIKRFETFRRDVIIDLTPPGQKLVELACGNGELLSFVASRYKFSYGFDISADRIKTAKKKLQQLLNKVSLTVLDIDTGLPLNKKTVDTVICEASLSCFLDVEFVLDEVYRILKPDGFFIVQVPNYVFILRRLQMLMGRIPKTSGLGSFGDGGMYQHFSYSSLASLLNQHGFEVIKMSNSGVLASMRRIWPSLLAGDIICLARKK